MAPKSVLDKVVAVIRAMKDHKGSSRQSIAKYLKAEFGTDNAAALRAALKKGVSAGVLVQDKQSFRVAGDAPIAEPEDERLEIKDVKLVEGDAAAAGDNITVASRGTLDSGTQFDAASKFTFMLGAGDVIKGWDRGIEGMRAGGKRRLTVPPKLGYGKKGCAPDIPPDATLHFRVELKKIA